MTITTVTSREFNQDVSKIKRASLNGPVFITDRGKPAHVLLTYAAYKKISSEHTKIADLLAMPGVEDIDFDIPQPQDLAQAADLS